MGKKNYLGGSSIVGPGPAYFRSSGDDVNLSRTTSADLKAQMLEDDKLRARGIDPIAFAKAQGRTAKAQRKKLIAEKKKKDAEIKSLRDEIDTLRAKRNAM